jgi:hypothetical protein
MDFYNKFWVMTRMHKTIVVSNIDLDFCSILEVSRSNFEAWIKLILWERERLFK